MSPCARFLLALPLLLALALFARATWRVWRDGRSAATRARIEGQARYWRMPI